MFSRVNPVKNLAIGTGVSFGAAADFAAAAAAGSAACTLKYDDTAGECLFFWKMQLAAGTTYNFTSGDEMEQPYNQLYDAELQAVGTAFYSSGSYTPATTGTYYLRQSMYYEYAETLVISPTPESAAAMIYSTGAGFNQFGKLVRYASAVAAGLLDPVASLLLHLDGNLSDNSPNQVAVTGGTGMSYVTGEFGQALQFSGDYEQGIFIPYGATVIGAGSWTIELWVKPGGTGRRALFAFANDYRLGIDLTDVARLWASSGSGWDILQSDGGGESSGIGSVALTVGDWNHIAYQYDANESRYTSYVNGVKDIDKVRSGVFVQTSEILRFGRWGGDGVAPCDDAVDEIRISQFVRYTANFTPVAAPFTS